MDFEQNRCSSQAAWKPCSPVRYTWQLKHVPDYKPGVDIASDIAVRILQHFRIPVLAARVTVYQKWPSKPTWRSSAWPAVSEKELRGMSLARESLPYVARTKEIPTTRALGSQPRKLALGCLLPGFSVPAELPNFRAPCCMHSLGWAYTCARSEF